MTKRKPYRPVAAGVSFHPDVVDYLDRLSVKEDCDRSALLNRIVRDYASKRGSPIGAYQVKRESAAGWGTSKS